jgi:hypothetical protein
MGLRSAFDLLLASDDPLGGMDPLIWQSLSGGASSKRHPWNEATFSTVAVDSAGRVGPKSRTVILRGVDRTKRRIDFHTDLRSAKIEQLDNENVCWLFYASATKIQLRLEGTASLVSGDEVEQAWQQTTTRSRAAYVSLDPPGSVATGTQPPDTSDRKVSRSESERGRSHFAIVRTVVRRADWLYLRREGHVRAELLYRDSGRCDVHWLVP